MCGIFGAVSLRHAPLKYPDCVGAMAATLAHRGPDGEQIVGHERARLGARRLAIMDLTTGDQPFQNPDRSIWMVCNGEIYNAPELRRECTQAGYPFRSTGDIETIVPLYERLGADAVSRLDGMFGRSEEHTSELQSRLHLVCRLLLEKKKKKKLTSSFKLLSSLSCRIPTLA